MKTRTVNLAINSKFKSFLKSIDDESLRGEIEEGAIITGGCIVSLLLNEPVSDYDVYFRTRDLATKVAKYYVAKFMADPPKAWLNSDGKMGDNIYVDESRTDSVRLQIKSAGVIGAKSADYQYFEASPEERADNYVDTSIAGATEIDAADEIEVDTSQEGDKPKYRPVFLSENAITLTHKIQIVLRFYGVPDEIHKNYDYVHCTNYWDASADYSNRLNLRPEAMECMLGRELRYQGSLYPICSLFRIRKFLKRGWTITAGQILKIALQISELNLDDVAVLKEQLIGVDAAYFMELIKKLKEKDTTTVDKSYLVKIIDLMF